MHFCSRFHQLPVTKDVLFGLFMLGKISPIQVKMKA